MDRQHRIHRREQCANAGCARLEAFKAQKRVEPDHASRMTAQPRSLGREQRAVLAVQPVGQQQHGGA
jgi:hypothetical protein